MYLLFLSDLFSPLLSMWAQDLYTILSLILNVNRIMKEIWNSHGDAFHLFHYVCQNSYDLYFSPKVKQH